MNTALNRSAAAQVTGLMTAGAGILVLFAAGVVTAPVPVGTIVLLATALLVALAPWRWAPALGLVVTLYLIVGFVLNEATSQLTTPVGAGELIGSLVLALGLFAAAVGGVVSSIRSFLDTSNRIRTRTLLP